MRARHGSCLPLEARDPIRIAGERLWQDLDGDVALQLRVVRAIDFAHTAFAKWRFDRVWTEPCPGCQSHVE